MLTQTPARCNNSAEAVGWVERSEPHQIGAIFMVGLAALDPPYDLSAASLLLRISRPSYQDPQPLSISPEGRIVA